jgi:hypothetical protein
MIDTEKLKEVKDALHRLRNSCYDALDGVWDYSTDEGLEGFDMMAWDCEIIAKALNLELEDYDTETLENEDA